MKPSNSPVLVSTLLRALVVCCAVPLLPATHAASLGAYLGCYTPSSAELQSSVQEVMRVPPTSGKAAVEACSIACYDKGYSLAILTPALACSCGLQTPPPATRLADTACEPSRPGVAVFYLHQAAASAGCRIAELPFVASNWAAAYNPTHTAFDASGTMTLTLDGTQGTRVASRGINFLYGSFQVKASVPCGAGVISSFYLRSSDDYADLATGASGGDFTELDFEFLSHANKPCSTWLNTFVGGKTVGELQLSQAEAHVASPAAFNTYTLHWQPSFVTWAVNGVPIRTFRAGQRTTYYSTRPAIWASPDKPMHPAFTMWTDTRAVDPFGGHIDASKGPYAAAFREMRMVLCDRPIATRGPSWLVAA